jgi:hypothetical protein
MPSAHGPSANAATHGDTIVITFSAAEFIAGQVAASLNDYHQGGRRPGLLNITPVSRRTSSPADPEIIYVVTFVLIDDTP